MINNVLKTLCITLKTLCIMLIIICITYFTHITLVIITKSLLSESFKFKLFSFVLICYIGIIYSIISWFNSTISQISCKNIKHNILIAKYNIINKTINIKTCIICFENKSNIILMPCEHDDFCFECVDKIKICPLCRKTIFTRLITN